MIKVKDLVRKYGAFTAVSSVSFEIPKGQIVGLLGHNGAGKTTTLKMLTGFLEPTSGEIEIAGMQIGEHRLEVQQKIGYLPESSSLYPEMTVLQYLKYVAELRGIDEKHQSESIKDAVIATDLMSKINNSISTLSKGYKQRVGVAQAIIHKPEILILDEPTNGLDPTQILAMRKLIKDLSKTTTVIISTHIMQEVEAICDRVLIILDGRLALDSSLETLRKGHAITLSLKKDVQEVRTLFSSISEITSIDEINSDSDIKNFCLETKDNVETIAPIIARTIAAKGWDLYRLHHEQRTLETVFKDVNRGIKGGAHV